MFPLCVNSMVPSLPSSSSTAKKSNLARFLERATPAPKANLISPAPSSVDDLNSQLQKLQIKSGVDYFTLGDLWECYNEFSAYGVRTKVSLGNGNTAYQYYVPFLSGIQIYLNESSASRNDPRSSGGDDAGSMMVENDLTGGDGGNNNSGNTTEKKFGHLYFSYFEVSPPYKRIPLRKKVAELATKYPELMTLRNVDLSPASWMAIAWYPIYHIPTVEDEKDLQAGFLTFHSLSSCFQGCGAENKNTLGLVDMARAKAGLKVKRDDGDYGIPLPPFGLSYYKVSGNLWVNPDTKETIVDSLEQAAVSWLNHLKVYHHDLNFFTNSRAAKTRGGL